MDNQIDRQIKGLSQPAPAAIYKQAQIDIDRYIDTQIDTQIGRYIHGWIDRQMHTYIDIYAYHLAAEDSCSIPVTIQIYIGIDTYTQIDTQIDRQID